MISGVRQQATALRGAVLIVFVLIARGALACTVCMGAPGDPLVKGANAGIWVLLGIVFVVQIGFIALFVAFWRRGRAVKRFREQFRLVGGSRQ